MPVRVRVWLSALFRKMVQVRDPFRVRLVVIVSSRSNHWTWGCYSFQYRKKCTYDRGTKTGYDYQLCRHHAVLAERNQKSLKPEPLRPKPHMQRIQT